MAIITFNEIIEVNGILEQKHLNFKLHLRDACGAQALWIEPLGNCACEGHYDEMHQVIEQYFLDKGLNVKYWDDESYSLPWTKSNPTITKSEAQKWQRSE